MCIQEARSKVDPSVWPTEGDDWNKTMRKEEQTGWLEESGSTLRDERRWLCLTSAAWSPVSCRRMQPSCWSRLRFIFCSLNDVLRSPRSSEWMSGFKGKLHQASLCCSIWKSLFGSEDKKNIRLFSSSSVWNQRDRRPDISWNHQCLCRLASGGGMPLDHEVVVAHVFRLRCWTWAGAENRDTTLIGSTWLCRMLLMKVSDGGES